MCACMTPELLQSIQYYLLFAAICGEVILLAILFKRFANQRIQRIGANVALSLVAISLTLIFGANRFGIFPEHVDALKNFVSPATNFAQADIASAPFDVKDDVNGSVINLIPLFLGLITLSAISVLIMVTIREYLARKRKNEHMKEFKRRMNGYK